MAGSSAHARRTIAATNSSQPPRAPRTALALDGQLAVGVVVVGELFARKDVATGADPDVLADDLAVAIRLAGVVDEAGDVAADMRVADPAAVDREAPDFAAFEVLRLAFETF